MKNKKNITPKYWLDGSKLTDKDLAKIYNKMEIYSNDRFLDKDGGYIGGIHLMFTTIDNVEHYVFIAKDKLPFRISHFFVDYPSFVEIKETEKND